MLGNISGSFEPDNNAMLLSWRNTMQNNVAYWIVTFSTSTIEYLPIRPTFAITAKTPRSTLNLATS